jgi:hypothetical protein
MIMTLSLIDFIKVDQDILDLVAKFIGQLYVTSFIVDEVNAIDNESELIDLGLSVIVPNTEDVDAAIEQSRSLSFEDLTCLFTATRRNLTCVTNDIRLRKFCEKEGVSTLWGLELVIELHNFCAITGKEAIDFAKNLRLSNPKYITEDIISRFTDRIKKLDEHISQI